MTIADTIDRVVRPALPAERLAAVRILTGLFATIYLAARAPALMGVAHHQASDFSAVGPVHLLSQPAPAWLVYSSVVVACALAIPFLIGWRFRQTGPAFAAALLWVLSYRNSFGMVFHTENLLVMHVVILALSDSAAAFSLDARRVGSTPAAAPRFGFALQCMGLVTALAYVLAGIAKLRVSGMDWATGDILRNHIAHDNLRKLLLGDSYSRLGAWAARHSWMFPPFAVLTLVIELGAPVVLLRGRLAKGWALLAWSFHAGVLALMWILFPYQLFFIAFASFFEPEKLVLRVASLVRKRRAPEPVAASE